MQQLPFNPRDRRTRRLRTRARLQAPGGRSGVERRPAFAAVLAVGIALASTVAAQPEPDPDLAFSDTERAYFEVFLDRNSYAPGTTARSGALMTIQPGWHTNSHRPTYDYLIPTELEIQVPEGWPAPDIVYPEGHMASFAFADEPLSVYESEALIYADLEIPEDAGGDLSMVFALTYQACDDRSCLAPVTTRSEVTLPVGAAGEPQNQAFFDRPAAPVEVELASSATASIGWMLLFGVIGGLILNAMPCVLPVLSLKVFSLIRDSDQGTAQVRRGSMATTAGILASFWALAAIAIVARSAGRAVGWGVQFQDPTFVAALAIIVTLFCLNLWGLFEIILPSSLVTRMGASQAGHSLSGHFASGLFTTLMATPCSAPFLGTAVGFALAQPPVTVLLIFSAVGVGMSLPYLALLVAPRLARYLPKPGAWMEQIKIAMGFLLAAAAVWLFYVLANQIPRHALAGVQLTLLALAAAVWTASRLRGRARLIPWAVAMVAAVGTLLLAGGAQAPAAAADTARLIQWQPFDRQQIPKLMADGKTVFVDVTADWCFTCKVNERLVLETQPVAHAFENRGVVAMKADWTHRDDDIADYLASHGRYSVPTYVLYRPGKEPYLFSELITQEGLIGRLGGEE